MGSFRRHHHDTGTCCAIRPLRSNGGPSPETCREHKAQSHVDSRAWKEKPSLDSTHKHPRAALDTKQSQGVSIDLYHLLLNKIKLHLFILSINLAFKKYTPKYSAIRSLMLLPMIPNLNGSLRLLEGQRQTWMTRSHPTQHTPAC